MLFTIFTFWYLHATGQYLFLNICICSWPCIYY